MTITTPSIEDVPINRFHQLLTIRSGGGSFVDGYVLSIIGVSMVQMTAALGLSTLWQGMIAAAALIGIFFGGFIGGWLTDHFGRKRIFFVGPVLFILSSLAQYWVESALALFLLRLLIGIGVGIEYPVATSLLVEFLPKKHRGPRLATLTILWFAGAALAYMVGNYLLRHGGDDAWRLVLASAAVIGAALFLIRLGTPESPRWLLGKGRAAEAEQVIKSVYGPRFSLQNLPEQPRQKKLSVWNLLHSGYGKRMLFVSMFWTCSVIPVFAVYAFAPKVLLALNLQGDWAAFGSEAITLLFVVGCIIATRLINVIGRRSMLIYSLLWSGLALLGLGAFHASSEAVILVLFGAYALFIGGAQVLQLVYPNELFPTEIRACAVGVGTSLSRVGAAVGTYLVPLSLDSLGIAQTMYAAAIVTLVGLLFAWALAPETRSLNLQQAASLT
ncbi:putative MFS transporter [Pseudomonas citronellolis]|uniref:MFS transporter n=1 Tax=Pseudomonas citronellolis TaxID=53408 RepID=UPI0020A14C4C|nr:MFS transporter [Pseudomonas citronellolis]MCP1646076.1 putative MFS transporter [Pseudomonas citronellolis]MCP1669058.1 putative MFS transporter [Pseudomonas citronellolis]MCP1700540.1 putative MFS transporter [Pseudomonas citronellolis]MCP1706868.1 putative MFS transporter [Pseudomonas citronellolis]MCP1800651.1 putative MFS transporter [Pseudomonas citronellolis]